MWRGPRSCRTRGAADSRWRCTAGSIGCTMACCGTWGSRSTRPGNSTRLTSLRSRRSRHRLDASANSLGGWVQAGLVSALEPAEALLEIDDVDRLRQKGFAALKLLIGEPAIQAVEEAPVGRRGVSGH